MNPATLTETEILEQPALLERLIAEETPHIARVAAALRAYDPAYAMWVARGTSDNAARYAQYAFAIHTGLASSLAIPSVFSIYARPPRLRGAAVIGVSQSGQSPDIVAVMREARAQGAFTLALTNADGAPLETAAEHRIALRADAEQSVAATKSYTASLMAIAMLTAELADSDALRAEVRALPAALAHIAHDAHRTIAAAERYTFIEKCVVLGRGYNYATAFEIALKIKEMTYTIAEPYSSADFVHGPIAVVERGFPVIAVVADGPMAAELTALLGDLAGRGAELIVISADAAALAHAHTPLPLAPGLPEWLSPIAAVMQGQLFALGLTLAKRLDPDKPRGLRKVTMTV
jgi:glucosamine--fructose-6-phosphate aminotransferase (isomerizing)